MLGVDQILEECIAMALAGTWGTTKEGQIGRTEAITASMGITTTSEGDEIVMVEEEGEVWMRARPHGAGVVVVELLCEEVEVEQAEEAEIGADVVGVVLSATANSARTQ